VEATISFESARSIRLFTGDPRSHRVLLLALDANGLYRLADRLASGGVRSIAVANEDRPALARALASWVNEL